MCRFVWTVEDWTLQELSSQYTGGLDRQDSRISATLDASLQSSKVGLHKQKYFSAIFWHDIVAESSSPTSPHDRKQKYRTKNKVRDFLVAAPSHYLRALIRHARFASSCRKRFWRLVIGWWFFWRKCHVNLVCLC